MSDTSIRNKNTGSGQQFNNNDAGSQTININENDSRKILWDRIGHMGFSHKAGQQCSRGDCFEGTREEVLRIIHSWRLPDGRGAPICWLYGAAAVGKTSIAITVANSCENDGLLASFFFFRTDPNRNHPFALMLAIAYGLAEADSSIREEISSIIKARPSLLDAGVKWQFEDLVIKPIVERCRQVADDSFAFGAPRLVIIDGLDECDNEETQSHILSIISSTYKKYPRFPLRFLICSRPEASIREAFDAHPLREISEVIDLNSDHFDPTADIAFYYTRQFQDIRASPTYNHVKFPEIWPPQEDIIRLVHNANGQFAYASIAVRFVRSRYSDPVEQLGSILDNTRSPFRPLDSLYYTILSTNPNGINLSILAAIVLLPIEIGIRPSPAFIELLLDLRPGNVSLTLQAMHSVLDIRGPNDEIRVYHTSFTDCLMDQERSGPFYIDRSDHRRKLMRQWARALSGLGKYNLDLFKKPDTRLLFTKWTELWILEPNPTPGLLNDLRHIDIGALFSRLWSLPPTA